MAQPLMIRRGGKANLLIAFIFLSGTVCSLWAEPSAYAKKGVVEPGGELGVSFSSRAPLGIEYANIRPTVKYFFAESWFVGASAGFSYFYNAYSSYSTADWDLYLGASIGKTFTLSERWFYVAEIGGKSSYYASKTLYPYSFSDRLNLGLDIINGVKYDIGHGMVGLNLTISPYLYKDIQGNNKVYIYGYLSAAYSVYFEWK